MPSWKHQKNLTIPDEPIVGVKPSDWNAELNAEGLVGHLVGVPSGTASQKLQDIPVGAGLTFVGGTLVGTAPADAPSNGTLYGRSNGAWAASAPASHTHSSSEITDLDGQIQTKITAFGGGIPEAPSTGVAFGRKNNAWVAVPDTSHTHVATQITDFAEAVEDRVATLLRPGTGITLAYNDAVNTLTITASGGGGVTDGDKGDITVSGGGTIFTIDSGVVTYAKMQSVATNTLLGRATAGTGIVEEIPLTSQGRQILASGSFSTMLTTIGAAPLTHTHAPTDIVGLQEQVQDWVGSLLVAGTGVTLNYNDTANTLTINSSGGGGGVTDGDKGDIVVSNTGATWMFDTGVVTPAAKTLLDDTSTTAMLTTLGAAPTTHTHPSTAITDMTTAGRSLITAADAAAQTALLAIFTSVAKGLVPASTGGTTKFLRADGTWVVPTASGGTFPTYSTNNVTVDRILDADSTSVDELADVVGTIILDLQAGGVGGGGGAGGTTQALAETRAAAISSTIDVAVKTLRTSGYALPGDGGGGLYKRVNAAPTHAAQFRSMDRNLFDGTSNATTGGYWELVPEGGRVNFAQFGGKNDSDTGGTTGSDNLAALNAAMNFIKWQLNPQYQLAWPIQFDAGFYRFSDTIEVRTINSFIGASNGKAHTNTTFFCFPANTVCMMFQANDSVGRWGVGPGAGEAAGSGMSNISVAGKASSTNHSLCGISVRTAVHFKHIAFYSIAGNALELKSGSGWSGGVNGATFEDLFVHSCSRDGIWINGGDSNVCTFNHIDLHGPGYPESDTAPITGGMWGCGIYDASYYGQSYTGVHIAGYGNHGVQHNGRRFFFVGTPDPFTPGVGGAPFPSTGNVSNATVNGAIEPGTNQDIWYDIGPLAAPNSQFPAWTPNPTIPHRLQIPIWTSGNASAFKSVYVEAQSAPCHGPGATTSQGGIAWWSRQSNGMGGFGNTGISSPRGFGGHQEWSVGEANNVWNGESMYAGVGNQPGAEPNKGIAIFTHGRDNAADAHAQWAYRYYNRDLVYTAGNDPNNDTYWVWHVTTPSTDLTFGRSIPQPYAFNPDKFALGRGQNARFIGSWMDWAALPNGEHAAGEIIINANTTLGPYKDIVAWRCLVAGTPGLLAELRSACFIAIAVPQDTLNMTAVPSGVSAIFTYTVAGAAPGDPVDVTLDRDTKGLILTGWVSATDTVSYQWFNANPTPLNIGYPAIKLRVRK